MTAGRYNDNEINLMFEKIDNRLQVQDVTLARIETQTVKTNGRVNKLEKYLLIVGCVTGTLVIVKFPEVFEIITKFI